MDCGSFSNVDSTTIFHYSLLFLISTPNLMQMAAPSALLCDYSDYYNEQVFLTKTAAC